uniref:Uncharacterized protein n=1 Tax=Anguilla anguilla TaxID=7936 RepID=A0A0E9Q0D2_ANGAN
MPMEIIPFNSEKFQVLITYLHFLSLVICLSTTVYLFLVP